MNVRRIVVLSAALLCCLSVAREARADSIINGYTSISYDPETNFVTGVTTTELDYAAQEWYMGRVIGRMADSNGNSLGLSALNDADRDGTVSTTVQTAGDADLVYTCTGKHGALADMQDYSQGTWRWVDYHNFGYRTYSEGTYVMFMAPFYGPGPRVLRNTNSISLGQTGAQTQPRSRITIHGYSWSEQTPEIVNDGDDYVDLKVTIFTSTNPPNGIMPGDRAIVDIGCPTTGADMRYEPSDQTVEVELSRGRGADATFRIRTGAANTYVGSVQFTVTITDVQRLNPTTGEYRSIRGSVDLGQSIITTADGQNTKTLNVVPKP